MQSDESSIAICLCVRLKKTSELAISDSRIVFFFPFPHLSRSASLQVECCHQSSWQPSHLYSTNSSPQQIRKKWRAQAAITRQWRKTMWISTTCPIIATGTPANSGRIFESGASETISIPSKSTKLRVSSHLSWEIRIWKKWASILWEIDSCSSTTLRICRGENGTTNGLSRCGREPNECSFRIATRTVAPAMDVARWTRALVSVQYRTNRGNEDYSKNARGV